MRARTNAVPDKRPAAAAVTAPAATTAVNAATGTRDMLTSQWYHDEIPWNKQSPRAPFAQPVQTDSPLACCDLCNSPGNVALGCRFWLVRPVTKNCYMKVDVTMVDSPILRQDMSLAASIPGPQLWISTHQYTKSLRFLQSSSVQLWSIPACTVTVTA